MSTFNDYAGMSHWEEHCDFEAGTENMELRAMRLEAEREWLQEQSFAAMDMEEEILQTLEKIVVVRDTVRSPAPSMDELFDGDDILF